MIGVNAGDNIHYSWLCISQSAEVLDIENRAMNNCSEPGLVVFRINETDPNQGTFLIQSTLVISTSLISNNRLSRSENLVPVLTWKSNNRYQNIVEKRRNCLILFVVYLYMKQFCLSTKE